MSNKDTRIAVSLSAGAYKKCVTHFGEEFLTIWHRDFSMRNYGADVMYFSKEDSDAIGRMVSVIGNIK